jgi:S-adenosylmethionine:tRNA-ribosyltransferase-isomerase (queuine synthetase)
MQNYKITMDNPDGTFETVWEKKATEETMTEEFYKVIKAQQKALKADPAIKWRVIRVFDELGHQIRQES